MFVHAKTRLCSVVVQWRKVNVLVEHKLEAKGRFLHRKTSLEREREKVIMYLQDDQDLCVAVAISQRRAICSSRLLSAQTTLRLSENCLPLAAHLFECCWMLR